MTRGGRPLRFGALVLGGWTAMRVAWLWPWVGPVPALASAVAPPRTAGTAPVPLPTPTAGNAAPLSPAMRVRGAAEPRWRRPVASLPVPGRPVPFSPADPVWSFGGDAAPVAAGPVGLPVVPLVAAAPARTRWSGSAWLLVRGNGPAAAAIGAGQLGGAQAGVRVAYALDRQGRLAVAARLASPLATARPEAAIGLAWRPTRAAVQIVAEERIGLGGGARGGPALAVVGGIDPTPVGAGFSIDGYGQAGAVARDGADLFADGAARIAHRVAAAGRTRIDLGIGAWGGAQRGVSRLDLGPSLGLALPVGARGARLTLDWRMRVAGDARPGTGAVLTLGADF